MIEPSVVLARGRIIVDRHRLEGLLGTGGMGSVRVVRHLELDSLVALKAQRVHRDLTAREFWSRSRQPEGH